jgi:Ca-activated chloride channel family protein
MLVPSLFGNRKVNPSQDLDEKTLIKIAESTGGYYYRARNIDELNNIYMRLDELEPVEKDKQYFRPRTELYMYPLALALALVGFLSASKLRWS